MITINDTALNDNQLIFVLRITLDSSTLRYATTGITLSSNTYSDSVLLRIDFSTLKSISKNINIYNGGGVGSLSFMEFSLSNYSGKYIENFYPSTSQDYLTARKVEVGFLWVGATTEAEITWLNSYYVNGVSVETNKITCFCIELSDIETIDLPYYKVQKDFDNGVSYFTTAPKENYGKTIPILYGDFTTSLTEQVKFNFKYCPGLLINVTKFGGIFCSHKVHTTSSGVVPTFDYALYRYISSVDSYQIMYKADNSIINNEARHVVYLTTSVVRPASTNALGFIPIRLGVHTKNSDILDLSNVTDQDYNTYLELNGGEQIALSTEGYASIEELGYIAVGADNVSIAFVMSSTTTDARDYRITYRNEALASPAGAYTDDSTLASATAGTYLFSLNDKTTAKKDATLPWTIDEVCSLEYILLNQEVTDIIRVYAANIQIKSYITARSLTAIRNNDGLRNYG